MSQFPNTRWSLISAARTSDEATAAEAIEELCRIYRPAVLAFARQAVHDEQEAEDLTQDFFITLLGKRRMEKAQQSLGKFRTFLLKDFQYTLLDHLKRERAKKRGGAVQHVSAEELTDGESPVTLPDTAVFDLEWAMAIVRESVKRLEAEESKREGGIPFAELKGFLPGFQATGATSYESLEARYKVAPGTLRVRVNRLREKFKETLNAVLADTVSTAADLENERQALLGGLLRSLG